MEMRFASQRYATLLAPKGLLLTQELVNSIAHPRPPIGIDLLQTVAIAQPWLNTTVTEWCRQHGLPAERVRLSGSQLKELRALRTRLRRLLATEEDRSATDLFVGNLTVHVRLDGVRLAPKGTGVAWLRAAVGLECSLAAGTGELPRLKLCRNPRCAVAFYDRSKNASGAWHDVSHCGNAANVRAYRDRNRRSS